MLLCVLMGPYISLCPLTCDSAQGRRSEVGDREKVVSTYTSSILVLRDTAALLGGKIFNRVFHSG